MLRESANNNFPLPISFFHNTQSHLPSTHSLFLTTTRSPRTLNRCKETRIECNFSDLLVLHTGHQSLFHYFFFFWAFGHSHSMLCCLISLCTPLQISKYLSLQWNHILLLFTAKVSNTFIMFICFLIPSTPSKSQKIFPLFWFPSPEIFFIIALTNRMKYFFSLGEKQKLKTAEIQLYSVSTFQCFLHQHHFTKWTKMWATS